MTKFAPFIILISSIFLATSAFAQDQYSAPGPYVQLAGSYARCSFEATDGSGGGDCSDAFDSSFGLNGRIGFRFNRFFTVEGQIEWISGFDIKSAFLDPSKGDPSRLTAEAVTYTINARFYPIEGRIQPYAIAGIGGENVWADTNLFNTDTYTSFVGRFGGGLDIYLTPQLALTGEFTYVAATEAKATYYNYYGPYFYNWFTQNSGIDPSYMSVSWGLMYRF